MRLPTRSLWRGDAKAAILDLFHVCPNRRQDGVQIRCLVTGSIRSTYSTQSTTANEQNSSSTAGVFAGFNTERNYVTSLSVSEAFDKAVSENASRTVCIFSHNGLKRTFAELHEDVSLFATGLQKLGLSSQSRIAIFAPTSYEWLIAKYAINRAGCVVVAINSGAHKEELGYILAKTEAQAVIIGEPFKYMDYYRTLCELYPELGLNGALDSTRTLKHIITTSIDRKPGTISMAELKSCGSKPAVPATPNDPAVIIQSSGSTGKPKSIVLSNGNVVSAALQSFISQRLRPSNIVLGSLPLYHSFGYLCIEANNTLNGLTTVYTSMKPKPDEMLDTIERERVTTIHGTPTTFFDILNCANFGKRNLSSLENGTIGATVLHDSVIRNIIDKLQLRDFMQGYGLSETSGACMYADGRNFRGYIPFCCTEFRIAPGISDETGGRPPASPAGHQANLQGEVKLRGATMFLGYLNDEEKTRAAFTDDGWLRTGDIGHINKHGLLEVCGRVSDIIIKGGVNISPAEIEEVLLEHQGVAEVHVVGVHDDRLGEEVCAFVKLAWKSMLTTDIIINHCASKLAHIKVPKYVVFCDEFPRTAVGKVSKTLLRRTFEEEKVVGTEPS